MKAKQIETILKVWEKTLADYDEKSDQVRKLFGWSDDAEFLNAVDDVIEQYTDAICREVGDGGNDDNGQSWLDWYRFECGMGKTPKKAYFANGKGVTVKSVRELAKMIAK